MTSAFWNAYTLARFAEAKLWGTRLQLAQTVFYDNPLVQDAPTLDACIKAVIKIPANELTKCSLRQLNEVYGCPKVWLDGSDLNSGMLN